MTQLDLIRSQMEAGARREASRLTAKARRNTSLVGEAHQLTGRLQRQIEEEVRSGKNRRGRSGYDRAETVAGPAWPSRPEADGYVRRTPVQPLHIAVGYTKRILLKALGLVIAAIVLLGLLWLVLNSGLLSQ